MAKRSPSPDSLTYSVQQAADLLGIGRSLLWNEVNEGNVPVLRVGKRVLIPRTHINTLIAQAAPSPRQVPKHRRRSTVR